MGKKEETESLASMFLPSETEIIEETPQTPKIEPTPEAPAPSLAIPLVNPTQTPPAPPAIPQETLQPVNEDSEGLHLHKEVLLWRLKESCEEAKGNAKLSSLLTDAKTYISKAIIPTEPKKTEKKGFFHF